MSGEVEGVTEGMVTRVQLKPEIVQKGQCRQVSASASSPARAVATGPSAINWGSTVRAGGPWESVACEAADFFPPQVLRKYSYVILEACIWAWVKPYLNDGWAGPGDVPSRPVTVESHLFARLLSIFKVMLRSLDWKGDAGVCAQSVIIIKFVSIGCLPALYHLQPNRRYSHHAQFLT